MSDISHSEVVPSNKAARPAPSLRKHRIRVILTNQRMVLVFTLIGGLLLTHLMFPVMNHNASNSEVMMSAFLLISFLVLPLVTMLQKSPAGFLSSFTLVQTYFVFIPILAIASIQWNFESVPFYTVCFYFTTFFAFVPVQRRAFRLSARLALQLFIIIFALNMGMLLLFYDINFNFLSDLRIIYEFRREHGLSLPLTNSLAIYAALPALIYVAVLQKRYLWLIPLASIGPILYMISGHKIYFVLPFFYILFAISIRAYSSIGSSILVIALTLTLIGTWLGNIWVVPLLVQRGFAVPGELAVRYFEFFKDLPNAYWGSFFGLNAFGYYPFGDQPLVKIFSRYYYGEETWANTGFYPFLFANFGSATFLILIPILLFFRSFDGLMKNCYASIYVGMIGGLLMVNGSFLSTLFGNGFLMTMICFIPLSRLYTDSRLPGTRGP